MIRNMFRCMFRNHVGRTHPTSFTLFSSNTRCYDSRRQPCPCRSSHVAILCFPSYSPRQVYFDTVVHKTLIRFDVVPFLIQRLVTTSGISITRSNFFYNVQIHSCSFIVTSKIFVICFRRNALRQSNIKTTKKDTRIHLT